MHLWLSQWTKLWVWSYYVENRYCSLMCTLSDLVCSLQSLPYLRSHYNIEDYVYFAQHCPEEHVHLHHFLLNPVFAPHIKHLLKVQLTCPFIIFISFRRQ